MLLIAAIPVICMLLLAWLWWRREEALSVQRRRWRSLMALAEEVLGAGTIQRMSRRLETQLPRILRAQSARLYQVNVEREALTRVGSLTANGEIPLQTEVRTIEQAAVLCQRNRILLVIPDAARSPLLQAPQQPGQPKAALFAPLAIRGEVLGVLAVFYQEPATPTPDEQAAIQHVANQVATALKLEQQREREDDLAHQYQQNHSFQGAFGGTAAAAPAALTNGTPGQAAGERLTSEMLRELRAPLSSIAMLASELQTRTSEPVVATTLRTIGAEANRCAEWIGKVASFGESEVGEKVAVDMGAMLSTLLEFREREWQVKGLNAQPQTPARAVTVNAVGSRLEQALLRLLVLVENSANVPENRNVVLQLQRYREQAQLRITYAGVSPEAGGLQLVRALAEAHGGALEVRPGSNQTWQVLLELPCVEGAAAVVGAPNGNGNGAAAGEPRFRRLTVLLLEPDAGTHRRLITILTDRGHRVVPAPSVGEAVETAGRLTFDVAFCSPQAPGGKWTELQDQLRGQVAAFALLADEPVADPSRLFRGAEGYVLTKPVEEAEVDRLLTLLQFRLQSTAQAG